MGVWPPRNCQSDRKGGPGVPITITCHGSWTACGISMSKMTHPSPLSHCGLQSLLPQPYLHPNEPSTFPIPRDSRASAARPDAWTPGRHYRHGFWRPGSITPTLSPSGSPASQSESRGSRWDLLHRLATVGGHMTQDWPLKIRLMEKASAHGPRAHLSTCPSASLCQPRPPDFHSVPAASLVGWPGTCL